MSWNRSQGGTKYQGPSKVVKKGVQKWDPLKNARCKGAHLPPKKSTNGLLVFGVILATFFDPLWPKLSKYVTYPMINFRPLKKGVKNQNVFLAFSCFLIFFLNFSQTGLTKSPIYDSEKQQKKSENIDPKMVIFWVIPDI